MRRTIGITTTGLVVTILAGWKSGDQTLGISAGVLAATAADALWPDGRRRPADTDSIGTAREAGGGADPAL